MQFRDDKKVSHDRCSTAYCFPQQWPGPTEDLCTVITMSFGTIVTITDLSSLATIYVLFTRQISLLVQWLTHPLCFLYICRKIKTKTCFYTCFSKTAWRVVLKAIFESGSYWEDLKNCKLLHSEQDVNFPDISKVGVHLKGQQ